MVFNYFNLQKKPKSNLSNRKQNIFKLRLGKILINRDKTRLGREGFNLIKMRIPFSRNIGEGSLRLKVRRQSH